MKRKTITVAFWLLGVIFAISLCGSALHAVNGMRSDRSYDSAREMIDLANRNAIGKSFFCC